MVSQRVRCEKSGEPGPNYTRGMELHGKYVLIGEGVRGSLAKQLIAKFKLSDGAGTVHVLTHAQLKAVVENKPKGFGEHPEKFHSDAIFLMGVPTAKAMEVFDPREGVDTIWPGKGMVYSQRLSAERTKSRLNKIMGSPLYKSMTIRNWNTTTKLLALLDAMKES